MIGRYLSRRWDGTRKGTFLRCRLSLQALAEEEFAVGVVNEHGAVVDEGPGTDHPDRAGGNAVAPDRLLRKPHLSEHCGPIL